MKKLLFIAILAAFTYTGSFAQTTPGNSAYGHSHKKAKKVKKHHRRIVSTTTAAQRRAINEQHKTEVKTIRSNDALTNQQQKDAVKQANENHKQAMKTATMNHKGKK